MKRRQKRKGGRLMRGKEAQRRKKNLRFDYIVVF